MSKKICGVYKIICTKNNKIYIGSSKSIYTRWKNHIRELNCNRHSNMFLQKDWDKYGEENFKFEILEETEESKRYEKEQDYLNKLCPFYRTGTGYNISEKSTTRNERNLRLFKPKNSENEGLYVLAKVTGCKPMLLDMQECNTLTRDEIVEKCYSYNSYLDIKEDIIEREGYDDWEW